MNKKHIISLHGSYFSNNYGDILLVNLFYDWIKEEFPSFQVNLPLVDKIKIKEMPEPTLTGLKNLIKSDCLVYCGGGYFGEKPNHKFLWSIRNFKRHALIGLIAIIFRIPIAIIGVEIGPISTSWFRRVILFIVRKSKIVLVRNEESLLFLCNYDISNAKQTADAVLTLNTEAPNASDNNDGYIVVHIPGYSKAKSELATFVLSICASLRSIAKKPRFEIIEDLPGQYNKEYEVIFNSITENGFEYSVHSYSSTNEVRDLIKKASAVFTTKLHVGITAAAYNRKVFSLYTHPKTKRFHYQIGNGDFCLPIEKAGDNIEELIERFFKSQKQNLPKEILQSALINKKELISFINVSTK